MDILAIVAWFQTNWVNIIAIYTSIIGAASIIVKLTPTLRDDTILLDIVKFVAKYIALNTNAPVERPK
jgi:hypothetical protein